MSEVLLDQVREMAAGMFENAPGSHDWDHTLRVVRLCRRMGPAEGCDMTVLSIAAYLHDIGRTTQDRSGGKVCHAAKGAEMAEKILEKLPLTPDQRANIRHCIRAHRFRGDQAPDTPEARVLFDADKLDSIGAVGVARAYLFAGEIGAALHNPDIDVARAPAYSRDDTGYREYRVKLSKVKDRILTRTGRELAEERHDFMTAFFRQFLAEYNGER